MRIIAFVSLKGGCGKSTTCVNVGAALAEMGRGVLIVDLDGNCCITRTLADVLPFDESIGAALLGHCSLRDVARDTPISGLHLAPGAIDLITLETMAATPEAGRADAVGRLVETALALELSGLPAEQYDYVMLDCPGGHPFMIKAALLACDEAIIPCGLSIYDLYATTPTLQYILAAREARGNGAPRFLGFLPNGAGKKGVPENFRELLAIHESPQFSPIRHSALLRTAAGKGKVEQRVVVLARRASPVAESFRQVAREIELGIDSARQILAAPASTDSRRTGGLAETPAELTEDASRG